MPELPEVETTIIGLERKVPGRTFLNVWTDSEKIIKKPDSFKKFEKALKGKKIKKVQRKGKNIIFDLSRDYSLLVHQKLTGHLLIGRWKFKSGRWVSLIRGPLEDPINNYIHLMFSLSGDLMLALSDLRKFAKVELERSEEIKKELEELGPDPLKISFDEFEERLKVKKSKIKQVLMDQKVISGIGNIYSSEILWRAKINPFRRASELSKKEMRRIYNETKNTLKKAIELKGESISDYRTVSGEKGGFDKLRKVYRRKICSRCGTPVMRAEISGRSVYYCPKCQK